MAKSGYGSDPTSKRARVDDDTADTTMVASAAVVAPSTTPTTD